MEELFRSFAFSVALLVETLAAAIIAVGAVEAIARLILSARAGRRPRSGRMTVWARFGSWLLLSLEFELAADVVRTAIAPGWNEIGQLGSIALIRTFLNYFLERDIEKYSEDSSVKPTINETAT